MADGDWARYRQLRGKTLPAGFEFRSCAYALEKLYKRDFYAATGVYRREGPDRANPPDRVVLKIYHTDPFWFLPLDWLGRWLCRREADFLHALDGIRGVPRLLARHGQAGMVREFIPGRNLREYLTAARPDPSFFPRLAAILDAVHQRGICHNDLHKPENILVRPDGSPVLIDFQIAATLPTRLPVLGRLARRTLGYLQEMDRYHLQKHHRLLCPDQLSPEQKRTALRKGVLLTLHGWLLRRPYRAVRHFVMNRFMRVGPAGGESLDPAKTPGRRAA